MKKSIVHSKYGKIEYVENFWNGKKELIVDGKYLHQRSKTIFIGEYDDLDKEFEVIGNYAAGATLTVDGQKFELVAKTKWYEYIIYFLPLILVLVWGNSPSLCKIFPVVGGMIGGAIGGGFSMAALIFGKGTDKILVKFLISLVTTIIVFVICALIGIALLGSLS